MIEQLTAAPPLLFLTLFVIGFLAAFVGSFVSGTTSLISLTSLLFLGISPQLATATYRFGALGWRSGGFWEFFKARKIVWRLVIPLSIVSLLGSAIGAHILVTADEGILNKIIGILILLFIPLSLIKNKLGVEKVAVSKTKRYAGYLIFFLVSAWTGFFAAGAGFFFLYVYTWFFGMTILETKGTDKIIGLSRDVGAIIVFLSSGILNIFYLLAFVPGMFLGATIAAKYTIKLGDERLRILILLTMALMSLKLILL